MTAISILYDGQDITNVVVFKESSFTARASGTPGEAIVVIRDKFQEFDYPAGKTLELYIDGVREWDGWVVRRSRTYWFDGHDAKCSPCPHVTPRRFSLLGADRNILFTRRVLHHKTDPTAFEPNIWPAGTADNYVLSQSISKYLDPTDGIDWLTKMENVGSPDPYVEFRVPGPTAYLGALFREVAQSVGAVFFIDPDRYLIYTDVNTATAPFGLSDQPAVGEVGYSNAMVLHKADNMVNDAMIWGAGQGKDYITFSRVTDAASVAAHGRWQNQGGFRQNLFNQGSVDRIANSIVYGSPSSKRGHKDNQVTVTCTIKQPGLRAAHKVNFESLVHGFSDVIPVREMTMTFPTPTDVLYTLRLSHELDEPWTTSEFWYPDHERRKPPPRCQTISCTYPTYEAPETTDNVAAASNVSPPPELKGTHRVEKGRMEWYVAIDPGPINVFQYYDDLDGQIVCSGLSGSASVESAYVVDHEDRLAYSGLIVTHRYAIVEAGPRVETWRQDYRLHMAGRNTRYPGAGVIAKITGKAHFSGSESDRLKNDFFPVGQHEYTLGTLRPKRECFGPRTDPGQAMAGLIDSGTTHEGIVLRRLLDDDEPFLVTAAILDINQSMPHTFATLTFEYSIEYFNVLPGGGGYLVGSGEGEEPCYEIPVCGQACTTPVYDGGGRYRIPVSYIPGSTKVWVNGIHKIVNLEYTEHDPALGLIKFDAEQDGDVYMCFDGNGYATRMLPDTSITGALFILPTSGVITGYFGPQDSLWPPAVWHGTYYPHFHNGVDFGVGVGTAVYAAAAGEVRFEDQTAGGMMIHIYHDNGMRTIYAHLSARTVPNLAHVAQGQLIALSGDSGQVTGPHLHWGMVYLGSPEDPLPYTEMPSPSSTTSLEVA